MRICILSDEVAFAHMLRLELEEGGHRVSVTADEGRLPTAELYIVDRDRYATPLPGGRVLAYGRQIATGKDVLHRPFSLTALAAAVATPTAARGLTLAEGAAILDGERIPLTGREHALLACLLGAGGAPVSRRDLFSAVWAGEGDDGVVTVYLHYLRKKLERGGKKLLYAVRGRGYALRMEEDKG